MHKNIAHFTFLFAWLSLFISFSSLANNQYMPFMNLTMEDGLSNDTVFDILEGPEGYIWIATYNGLNRFDGYQFKQFETEKDNPRSLASNDIRDLMLDHQNRLWVSTYKNGLHLYHPQTMDFTRIAHNPEDPNSLSDNRIREAITDNQGNIWVASQNGLNRLDAKTLAITRFNLGESLTDEKHKKLANNIHSLLVRNDNEIWVGTRNGIKLFNTHNHQVTHFIDHNTDKYSPARKAVHAMVLDQSDTLWIGTYGGLYKLEQANSIDTTSSNVLSFKRLTDLSESQSIINKRVVIFIDKDKEGNMWFSPHNYGLFRADSNDNLSHYLPSLTLDKTINDKTVFKLFQDSNDTLWIGTMYGGVNIIHKKHRDFGHYFHDPMNENSLTGNIILTTFQDSKKQLWVTTRSGVNRIVGNKFYRYQHDSKDPFSLTDNNVHRVIEDRFGQIWLGSLSGGLNLYQPETDNFSRFRRQDDNPYSLVSDNVASMIQHSSGLIWIATGRGISKLDPQTKTFKHKEQFSPALDTVKEHIIAQMFQHKDGSVWLASDNGLIHISHDEQQAIHYLHDPNDPTSIGDSNISTLLFTHDNNLWIGHAKGISIYNPSQKNFRQINAKQGMFNGKVMSLLEDDQHNIWITSSNGLSQYNPKTKEIKYFDKYDGLDAKNFTDIGFKAADGKILLGGSKGFSYFDPSEVSQTGRIPKVVLTDFRLNNKSVPFNVNKNADTDEFVLDKPIERLEHLTLTHLQNLVSFEFAAIDFISAPKVKYAYQLMGQDKDWIYTNADNRRATYTNLAPGEYRLNIKASDNFGKWPNQYKTLAITVLPPWWQSKTAYAVWVLTIMTLAYSFYRYRTRQLVLRAEQLEQAVNERTTTINQLMEQKDRMFANISHEFKTPLTLILNPMDDIIESQSKAIMLDKIAMMKRNGQRLLRMVEQLLELSRIETVDTNTNIENYSLAQTISVLTTSFQPLVDANQHQLIIEPFDDVVLTLKADSLDIMLTNLISNAIKYTPKGGKITISVISQDQHVLINVKDTGVGIDKQNQALVFNRFTRANQQHHENIPGAGIGLALVKELAQSNHGDVSLNSESNQGCTFSIKLPLPEQQGLTVKDNMQLSHGAQLEIDSLSPQSGNDENVIADTTDNDNKPQVLIIDDSNDMLKLVKDTLSQHFHCICRNNGEDGLTIATEQLPDLVISDVMMPGISGFEVLKRLKTNSITEHIPVVLLTAKGDVESRIQGWENQADEFLDKPFYGQELIARINNLLSVRQLLSQRFQHQFASQHDNHQPQLNPVQTQAENEDKLDEISQKFSQRLENVLAEHYNEEDLSVNTIAEAMNLSQRQLNRKTKSLLGMTLVESLRAYRLNKAVELLNQGMTPSVIAFEVGFSSHSYFGSCFKAQFGCTPKEFINGIQH